MHEVNVSVTGSTAVWRGEGEGPSGGGGVLDRGRGKGLMMGQCWEDDCWGKSQILRGQEGSLSLMCLKNERELCVSGLIGCQSGLFWPCCSRYLSSGTITLLLNHLPSVTGGYTFLLQIPSSRLVFNRGGLNVIFFFFNFCGCGCLFLIFADAEKSSHQEFEVNVLEIWRY